MTANTARLHNWTLTRDDEGHRDYLLTWLITTDDGDDGPETVLSAPGLPSIGTAYSFGNDSDTWAFAYPRTKVRRVTNKPNDRKRWFLDQTFSTRPLNRCQTAAIENPLLEPAKISGSGLKYLRKYTEDKDGDPLLSSSGERYIGNEVQEADYRLAIQIEFNAASFPGSSILDALKNNPWNSTTMWGFAVETVRLTEFDFEKLYYGVCTAYYRLKFGLEIGGSYYTRVPDEGTMCFTGTDPNNPKHYEKCKDANGENIGKVLLDGSGNILTDVTSPVFNQFELKGSSNLLAFGLPASI